MSDSSGSFCERLARIGPGERLRGGVVALDEGQQLGLEVGRRAEDAPLEQARERIEKNSSIWLSQEAWVGVK